MTKQFFLTAVCAAVVALGLAASGAAAAPAKFTHCSNGYFAPQYLEITHVYEQGTNCAVAHGVATSYMHAVTQTLGAKGSQTGNCFGAHSYGRCAGVRFRHLAYTCFHFSPLPARTRGLVRCTRPGRRVSFNIRS